MRFDNTWDTDGLRLAMGFGVLLAGVGLTVLLGRLLQRGR